MLSTPLCSSNLILQTRLEVVFEGVCTLLLFCYVWGCLHLIALLVDNLELMFAARWGKKERGNKGNEERTDRQTGLPG